MSRWQPDAQGRLGEAALLLFADRGYDQVTVADIAEQAGVTPRTFFRHFADKRDVLFSGSETLTARLTSALAAVPTDMGPLASVAVALTSVAGLIGTDHEHSSRRGAVIAGNAELREREGAKLASWGSTLAAGLGERGVDAVAARLAAETGVVVFRSAFDSWLAGPGDQPLTRQLDEAFTRLRSVVLT